MCDNFKYKKWFLCSYILQKHLILKQNNMALLFPLSFHKGLNKYLVNSISFIRFNQILVKTYYHFQNGIIIDNSVYRI